MSDDLRGDKDRPSKTTAEPCNDTGRVRSIAVPLHAIDASDLRAVMVAYRDALSAHREAINNLNVYPVPDGDTGTNMALTVKSVVDAFDTQDDTTQGICDAIAHGSLMGARGNSGVIMSQILRGFTAVAREHTVIDGAVFAEAMTAAATGAYEAVGDPVEGTILTVVREAADAAVTASDQGADLPGVLEACRDEAFASLQRTPALLQVLADADVVDAGGTGLVLFLDAALWVADARPIPEPEVSEPSTHPQQRHVSTGRDHDSAAANKGASIADLRYEVMFLLNAPDDSIEGFKTAWASIGDSIVVVGGDGLFNCHIHCDDIGAAIECGIGVGRPHRIRVTDLRDEVDELDWVRAELGTAKGPGPDTGPDPVTTAVVAVGVGIGVVSILSSMGARAVVTGGQTMNPSTSDLLEAVEGVRASEVIILPNNKNIVAVAEQVVSQTDRTVRVVATHSIPEALACLMAYDPHGTADLNAANMTAAAADVVTGEVTQAVRDSSSAAGPIARGDWLGIIGNEIVVVAASVTEAATSLLEQVVGEDHELLTVICGTDAAPESTAHVRAWMRSRRPNVEVEIHQGGQPMYPYLFGVE